MKAGSYAKAVLNTLKHYGILDYLYFLATDGAPVVSSDQNGLYGIL